MVVVIQALVILFTGAMEGLFRPGLQRVFDAVPPARRPRPSTRNTVKPES